MLSLLCSIQYECFYFFYSPQAFPTLSATPATVGSHDTDAGGHKTSPKLTTPTKALSKRLHNFSISKIYHHKHGAHGRDDGSAGATPTRKGVEDKGSHDQSHDLDREGFPGGDAMLEVLTRLQCYQDGLQSQLDVCS